MLIVSRMWSIKPCHFWCPWLILSTSTFYIRQTLEKLTHVVLALAIFLVATKVNMLWFWNNKFLIHCTGASSEAIRTNLAKLKSVSSSMHRAELIEAARRTFCYRSTVISTTAATFAECVESIPCYVTIPTIVSFAGACSVFSLSNQVHAEGKWLLLNSAGFVRGLGDLTPRERWLTHRKLKKQTGGL